jgi:hypothetical protein
MRADSAHLNEKGIVTRTPIQNVIRTEGHAGGAGEQRVEGVLYSAAGEGRASIRTSSERPIEPNR